MPIDRHTGEFIDLTEAKALTGAHQEIYKDASKCFYLGADKIQKILDQEGCIGIRTYMAFNQITNAQNIIMVGVNENCEDMTDGLILDRSFGCPTDCDGSSPLVF